MKMNIINKQETWIQPNQRIFDSSMALALLQTKKKEFNVKFFWDYIFSNLG